MDFQYREKYGIDDLLKIMEILRGENGCPWDREQTHESIRKNFIEETYEVCEAIDNSDTALLKEELGDVLLQVVFHSQMEKEAGTFDFSDVCDGICKKLIKRHPHIFSDVKADTSDEVLKNWDKIKLEEKGINGTESVKSVPVTLPSLMRAQKVQKRAAKAGLYQNDPKKLALEIKSAADKLCEKAESGADYQDLPGKLLFASAGLLGLVGADGEEELSKFTSSFIKNLD